MYSLACASDNYDVNAETPDGRNTLHSTVGICYQNRKSPESSPQVQIINHVGYISGRPRRCYSKDVKAVSPFHASLKQDTFALTPCGCGMSMKQGELDFLRLFRSFNKNLPLFNGFFSKFCR